MLVQVARRQPGKAGWHYRHIWRYRQYWQ